MPSRTVGIGLGLYIVGSMTYKIFVVEGTDTFHVHLKQWEGGRVREGRNRHAMVSLTVTSTTLQCVPSPSDCQKAWHASTERPVCKISLRKLRTACSELYLQHWLISLPISQCKLYTFGKIKNFKRPKYEVKQNKITGFVLDKRIR